MSGSFWRAGRVLLMAAVVAGAACSSGSNAPPPPQDDDGGGGESSGGDLTPWNGVGNPYAGTSAELLDVASAAVSLAPDYVLSGMTAAGVTAVAVELNGAAATNAALSAGRFTLAVTLTPGVNRFSLAATDGAGAHAPLNQVVVYEDGAPTTASLIDAALASTAITPAQAIEYRVLAAFGDASLPAEYQGADAPDGTTALLDAWMAGTTLPQAIQDALAPFFIPDFYALGARTAALASVPPSAAISASWLVPCDADCVMDDGWVSLAATHVKVWWDQARPGDAFKAQAIVDAIEGPKGGWATLAGLLGNAPVSDGTSGGDARLDVILAEMANDGATTPIALLASPTPIPAFIRVKRELDLRDVRGAAIHELMHAFVWGRPLAAESPSRYHSLSEATANWAANRVLPTNNWEHKYNRGWFEEPHRALFDVKDPSSDRFPYGTWMFYRYLSSELGDGVISQIWQKAAAWTDQQQVLEAAIAAQSGGAQTLEKLWPRFARAAWNGPPERELYALDLIGGQPSLEGEWQMYNPGTATLTSTLPAFAARYFRFEFPEPTIRSFLVLDGAGHELRTTTVYPVPGLPAVSAPAVFPLSASAARGITLQAIRKIGSTWQDPENWTTAPPRPTYGYEMLHGFVSDKGYAFLCQETQAGAVDELVLILSNGETSQKPLAPIGDPITVKASRAFCDHLSVSASVTEYPATGVTHTRTYFGMLWLDRPIEVATPAGGGTAFLGTRHTGVMEQAIWSIDGTDDLQCRWDGAGAVTDPYEMSLSPLEVYTWARSPDVGAVNWQGFLVNGSDQEYSVTCPPAVEGDPDVVTTYATGIAGIDVGPYLPSDAATQAQLKLSAAGALHLDLTTYCPGCYDGPGTIDVQATPY